MNDHSSMILLLHHAVGPIYIILTAAALLSTVSPALKSLSSHGKTRLCSSDKCSGKSNYDSVGLSLFRRIWSFLLNSSYLSVNKRRFIDFYVVGSIITTITILISSNNLSDIHATTDDTRWLPIFLLLMHLIRRFCECMWVQKSVSTSRMHVAGYLLGVIHYLCLPFVFIPNQQKGQDSGSNTVKSFMVFMSCHFFQYQQHRHHAILGNLRPNKTTKSSTGGVNSYRIPKRGWFKFVSCPHYLAEIMIYFMLAILMELQIDMTTVQDEESGVLSRIYKFKHWIVLVWVSTNLSISAGRTHGWYISTFGKTYPQRKRLFPFLW